MSTSELGIAKAVAVTISVSKSLKTVRQIVYGRSHCLLAYRVVQCPRVSHITHTALTMFMVLDQDTAGSLSPAAERVFPGWGWGGVKAPVPLRMWLAGRACE